MVSSKKLSQITTIDKVSYTRKCKHVRIRENPKVPVKNTREKNVRISSEAFQPIYNTNPSQKKTKHAPIVLIGTTRAVEGHRATQMFDGDVAPLYIYAGGGGFEGHALPRIRHTERKRARSNAQK